MSDIKVGDFVVVKDRNTRLYSTYGYYEVKALLPNGYKEQKCRILKLHHHSSNPTTSDEWPRGYTRYRRLIDCKLAQPPKKRTIPHKTEED